MQNYAVELRGKVTIYMIYIEPLFLHVNFKPTNHDRAI